MNRLADGSRLPAIAVGILLCACVLYLLAYGRIESSPESFLPPADRGMPPALHQAIDATGAQHLLLAGISGGNAGERAAASRALTAELTDREDIARIANGGNALSWKGIQDLLPYRYLLSPCVSEERFSVAALTQALSERRAELSSPVGPPNRRWMAADPTGELRVLRSAWIEDRSPPREHGVWVSGDRERALLVIETVASASLDEQERTLTAIRNAFRSATSGKDLRLTLTGPAVFAVGARERIRSEAKRLSVAATSLVAILLGLTFRSAAILLVIGVPLASAILIGTTTVTLLFGAVHGIALAFGCTLVGVAVDYPLHLFSHRRPDESAHDCIKRIWPTLRLGVITTVLGYLAMATAAMPGMVQLGIFAISGLLAAALTTRYLLPWLTPAGMRSLQPHRSDGYLNLEPPACNRWVLLAAAAACIGVLGGAQPIWQSDLNALSPVPAELRALDARLRADLGVADLRYVAIIRGEDAQQVLERSEALDRGLAPLVQSGAMTRAEHPAALLPSRATQLARRAALPPAADLELRVARIAGELGFRENAFEDFIDAVRTARRLEPLTPADMRQTPFAPYLESRLFETGESWWGLVRFIGVTRPDALHGWFREHAREGVEFVDTKRRIEATLAEFRNAVLVRSILGAALILLTLVVGLRSVPQALAVAGPAFLAAACSAALLVTFGERLTLFHLMSLLLVVGLGLDYALFFNRCTSTRLDQGQSRRALLLCGLSTLGVFGLLCLSGIALLRDIGLTVTLGTLLALSFGWLGSRAAGRRRATHRS